MPPKPVALLVLLVVSAAPALLWAAQPSPQETARELKADSRAPYVHRLTLYDHDGKAIDPQDEPAVPYSPRATCGKCHPYAEISAGWHFHAPRPTVAPGRPGEPWWLVDPSTGTVLPLSGRAWPGTYTAAAAGLSDWQFVKRFGRHLPGGGAGEPSDDDLRSAPEKLRWPVSGRLEIDCMVCHSADQQHDPAEAARQIEAENFRWAPTVALGLAAVRGEARKAPDDWDPLMPPDPDFPERAGPKLVWNASRFDVDNRVLFNITRRIPNERCYFCHSFREVGAGTTVDLLVARDVHLAAGLLCVDCHRNRIDHRIVRGYDGEAAECGEPWRAAFACEGCHLGTALELAAQAPLAVLIDGPPTLGGRYGAPHPQHRGLPPLHFQKLTCTACHAGPWPELDAKQFQTALAHGLGLATRERAEGDAPAIVGPIFARQADGRIAPQRMVWPRFWGWMTKDGVAPVSMDGLRKVVAKSLPKPTGTGPPVSAFSTEEITQALDSLAAQPATRGEPVYVQHGFVIRRSAGESAASAREPAAAPLRWSVAHDVRPASQSLGIRGCPDCHADDAPLYFGAIVAAGRAGVPGTPPMVDFRGDDARLARLWALAFTFRPAFRAFHFACAGLIALLLLRCISEGFRGANVVRDGLVRGERIAFALFVVAVLIQAITGFGDALGLGQLEGWRLLVHMFSVPVFVVGLTGLVLCGLPRSRFGAAATRPARATLSKLTFWLVVPIGFVVMSTMLSAMLPVIGYAGQNVLAEIHAYAAKALLVAIVLHVMASLLTRQRSRKVKP